jgi:predicted nucleic acid-binding protein
MNSVFFDTSALYSAIFSPKGAARELVRLSVRSSLVLFISDDVVTEATRNIGNKAPELLPILNFLTDVEIFEFAPELSPEEVQVATQYVEEKDAMIVASAMKAEVKYLATFDRKHLINPIEVSQESGLIIATPGDILSQVRHPVL